MTKRICLLVLLIVSALPLFPQQDKAIITVLDFSVNEVSQAEMKSIISLLSSALFKTTWFTVIDVSQRETVLKELQFSMSGCSDESCMLEVGKLLSAEAIVIGSIGRVGTKYVLSSKMLETETARTISTADGIYVDLDDLLEHIAEVALELAAPYGAAETARAAEPSTGPPASPRPAAEPAGSDTEHAGTEAEPAVPRRPVKPMDPGTARIVGFSLLGTGIACACGGTYFLVVSLPLIFDYLGAKGEYEAADDLSIDINALWEAYESARAVAEEGNANTNLIVGASLAGAGLALGITSIFFLAPRPASGSAARNAAPPNTSPLKAAPAVSVGVFPIPGATTMSFRLRF